MRLNFCLTIGILFILFQIAVYAIPVVELTIRERGNINRVNEPVLMGVPLPEAANYTDSNFFSLRDQSGTVIPCEFRTASKWLRNRDAIRWLHLDFQINLNANQTQKVVLHFDGAPYQAASSLSVQDLGDKFEVNTGIIKFTVKKKNFNLLDEVWVDESGNQNFDNAHKIVATHQRGLVHRQSGTDFLSSLDANSTATIERQGTMAIVIKATGQLKSSTGGGSFHFITRVYAYNNSKIIKIENTVENWNELDNTFILLTSLKTEIPLVLGSVKNVLIGKPSGYEQTTLSGAESAYCFTRRQGSGLINIEGVMGGRVSGTFDPKGQASKDVGWAALYDGSKGCAIGMKNYWRMFPTSVEAEAGGKITAAIFSERAAKPLQMWSGQSRTQVTRFVFFNDDTPQELRTLAAGADNPLFAIAPPSWYCRYTLSMGRVAEKNPSLYTSSVRSTITSLDNGITAGFNNCYNLTESRFGTDGYGFLEWGTGLHYTWGSITDPWNLSWNHNYYDLAHMAFHQFIRSGDLRLLDFAIAHADHIEDVHQCHFRPDFGKTGGCRYCPSTNHVAWDQDNVPHVENHPSHHKTQSMFENYWLTGDQRALDVSLQACRWLRSFGYSLTQGDNIATYTRRVSFLIHTLAYGYYQARNSNYLSQLLVNWLYLKQDIRQNVPMGQNWMNGWLMEGMIDLYHLYSDYYQDPGAAMYTEKDSVIIYLRIYADRKYGVSGKNSGVGYSFLSAKFSPTYQSQAITRLSGFSGYFANQFKDFASSGRNFGNAVYYLVIPDSLENLVSVEDKGIPKQKEGAAVLSVEPNPFHSKTRIQVHREQKSEVRSQISEIKILDITGKMVYQLTSDLCHLTSGISWNASQHPTGIYIIELKHNRKKYTKRVMLIK